VGFGEYIQAETQALSLDTSAQTGGFTMLDMDDFELAVLVKKA
jgi:isoleucyl-tRNA synthetase